MIVLFYKHKQIVKIVIISTDKTLEKNSLPPNGKTQAFFNSIGKKNNNNFWNS